MNWYSEDPIQLFGWPLYWPVETYVNTEPDFPHLCTSLANTEPEASDLLGNARSRKTYRFVSPRKTDVHGGPPPPPMRGRSRELRPRPSRSSDSKDPPAAEEQGALPPHSYLPFTGLQGAFPPPIGGEEQGAPPLPSSLALVGFKGTPRRPWRWRRGAGSYAAALIPSRSPASKKPPAATTSPSTSTTLTVR